MPSTLVFPGGRLDDEDGDPTDDASWERAAQRECREEAGLDLAGRPMSWFDTWLTPSAESSRRYLARFFAVALGADEGDEAEADGHETHEGRWASVSGHLAAWQAGEVDLPPPTVAILFRLRAWVAAADGGDATAAVMRYADALDPDGVILPKVTAIDGAVTIIMPHDPAYESTAGEALPAPARVQSLPRRFVRVQNGWQPQ